jgi:type IV pilus assembly protein PilY1
MMKTTRRASRVLTSIALLALGAAWPLTALAGSTDVDLFTGGGNVEPNIVILLDNSGSMDRDASNTSGCNTSDATASNACRRIIASEAVKALVNRVNPYDPQPGPGPREVNARLGLMTYVDNGASVEVPVSDTSSDAIITAVDALGSRSVGTPIGGSILDAGRYYAGTHQWDKDGAGGNAGLPLWGDITSVSPPETVLADPIDLACRESFLIFITDGLASGDNIDKSGFVNNVGDSDGDLGAGEGSSENVSTDSAANNSGIQWADDISDAMAGYDFRPDLTGVQNVITHVIGFTVNDPSLERISDNGLGEYYVANDAAQLATALDSATQQVFDRQAQFSTAVVPTSRTLAGAAFYNAYFEPSRDAMWAGHLEAYRIAPNGDILDDAFDPAIDSTTGLLIEPHNYVWDAATGTNGLDQNTSRTLLTTIGTGTETFAASNGNITEALLDVAVGDLGFYPGISTTSALRTAIIDYVHGKDTLDDDGDSNTTELRDVVLGDIFHSTPRIVGPTSRLLLGEDDYDTFHGDYFDRGRVIYAGANDGVLHAFDAGAYSTGDDPDTTAVEGSGHIYYSTGDGHERFGYVPGVLLDDLKRIPLNTPRTFYFVDGSPIAAEAWLGDIAGGTAHFKDTNEWATVLVMGMREGGAGYLALDITDPDATSGDDHFPYPSFLWEFTDPDLGEAWSEAIITRVRVEGASGDGDECGYADGDGDCREQWVAIIGGGYRQDSDPNFDGVYLGPSDGGWTDASKAIYVIALDTGAILAKVEYDASTNPDMVYALPSTPAVLDLDQDGFADVVYIGDLGGQLWKWDISEVGVDGVDADTLVDNWPSGVFFRNDPEDMGGGVFHYRSFFQPPGASIDRGVLTLAFGSGEREDLRYPGDATKDDENRFYVLKDQWPTGPYAFVDPFSTARLATESNPLINVTGGKTDPNHGNFGFFFKGEEGEKFTSDVIVFAGYVIMTSYTPNSPDVCTAATGESFLYVFRIRNGGGFFDTSVATAVESRRMSIGQGLGSSPRVSMGEDPDDDKIYVKTSKGKIMLVQPPERTETGASIIYWRPRY